MAEVMLFHHVQGLTPGVRAFADDLRAAGHRVTSPDLFGGATFDTIEEGADHAHAIGFEALLRAASDAAAQARAETVYAGFSLGALAAHRLAQTRRGATGALLYHHGDVPLATFGETWPPGVDVQIHLAEDDEYREPGVAEDFVEQVAVVAAAELHLYPGSVHLFTDSSLSGYEPESARLVMERTLEFLDRGARGGPQR